MIGIMMEYGMRGDRLKALRESLGLTQGELAEELDISEPQIWRYENGESKPRGDVVIKFATLFGVSSDYLLGLTDNPGVHMDEELSPKERAAIVAWRRGQPLEAVKIIVGN